MPPITATTASNGTRKPPTASFERSASVDARAALDVESDSFEAADDAIAGDTASEQAATAIIIFANRINILPFSIADTRYMRVMA